ncbi:GntR family transcriptional regulator [Kitasatospora sp. NPDC001527]|uniref:GntR family transcriptional regulator n=1 Tax=Kitasatospora sp. NPDC001527 TaxID=3154519 RepID=UPI00332FBB49
MAETPIDPRGRRAPYQQVADVIIREIDAGKYGPDGPIPSEPALCERFGVARETVRRALGVLRDAGRIETLRGRGSFVIPRSDGQPEPGNE